MLLKFGNEAKKLLYPINHIIITKQSSYFQRLKIPVPPNMTDRSVFNANFWTLLWCVITLILSKTIRIEKIETTASLLTWEEFSHLTGMRVYEFNAEKCYRQFYMLNYSHFFYKWLTYPKFLRKQREIVEIPESKANLKKYYMVLHYFFLCCWKRITLSYHAITILFFCLQLL